MSARVSANEQNAGFNSPPPPTGTNCWICLEDDGLLLRNCACRGDSSGYAHVSCLAEHARTVSDKAIADLDLDIVRNAWTICPNCKQRHKGDMSLAMVEAFVEYASRLPNDSFSEEIRFSAQILLGDELEEAGDLGESRTIYEHLLDSIQPSDTDDKLAEKACIVERLANSYVGEIRLATDESIIPECTEKVIYYYETAYCMNVEVYGAESVQAIRAKHVLARFNGDMEAFVQTGRALCNATEKEYGSESVKAMLGAKQFAAALKKATKLQEASEILKETLVKARRVLGPEHQITLNIQQHLEEIVRPEDVEFLPDSTAVIANIFSAAGRPNLVGEYVGEQVEVLGFAKDRNFVVCRKRRSHAEEKMSSKFKVKKVNLIYSSGTQVTVIDLAKAKHLNGQTGRILSYKKDLNRYAVAVGEDFRGLIKPDNLELNFM